MDDKILVDRAQFYRGLLVIPLAIVDGGYGFAIVDPGHWEAVDRDWQEYESIAACLSAGCRRIDRYFSRVPSRFTLLLEAASRWEDGPLPQA